MELLYQISISPCRNPRAVDMRVPPALAAICAKATMLAPTDRYPSATDLAHDIDLWLAGEPVSAYREPWQAQAWRWARRHRTLVTTSAMLLLTSVLGLSLNAWMVGKEQERTKNALVRAQKNLDSARQAVDQMLTGVAAKDLENAPRMESLRRDLFKKALTFYQTFANDSPDDPELRIDVAEAYEKVGDIASLLGDPVPATNAYGRSIQLLESLKGIETLENATAYRLAHVHNSLGEVLRKAGDLTDAEREYRIAIEVLQTSDPGPTDMHGELARVDYNLGLLLFESNRADEAEVLFNDSIASYNELLRRDPNQQEFQQGLARTFINLGMLKRNSKQTAQCEAAYGKAITILKALLAKDPNAQEYRHELGTALLNLGNARLSDPARRAEAEQPYRDSLAQLGPLVTDFPATPLYLKELANATNGLGSLLYRSDKSDEAEKAWRNAIVSFENLMEVQPDVPEHESLAALTKHNLAYLLFKKSKSAEACELLESAKTLQQSALAANPRHQQRQEFLRFHCRTLAEVYVQMNLHREVREIANELAGLEGVSSKDVYRCARFMANTIALVRADESLSAEVRTAAVARNTREAISLLERAVAMGYSDRKEIETQADFEALRSDQDFQKLVEKLPISNQ